MIFQPATFDCQRHPSWLKKPSFFITRIRRDFSFFIFHQPWKRLDWLREFTRRLGVWTHTDLFWRFEIHVRSRSYLQGPPVKHLVTCWFWWVRNRVHSLLKIIPYSKISHWSQPLVTAIGHSHWSLIRFFSMVPHQFLASFQGQHSSQHHHFLSA